MPHMFGLGKGWVSEKYDKKAKEHGAYLVNYTDAPCNCGCGCAPHTCPKSRRHWFERTNQYGYPHDDQFAKEALANLGLLEE